MIAVRCFLALCLLSVVCLAQEPAPLEASAESALHRAVAFFREQVSVEGSYLWRYSADLKVREGEGKADDQTGWVQPPGTPDIGEAYLVAYSATKDDHYLDAARETANALVRTQLQSGGWTYRIHFDEASRAKQAYRVDGRTEGQNTTTLDDNTTQAALRFLMQFDKATDFKEEKIHECVMYGLDKLIEVQYPNGAWPQRFSGPPDASEFPVVKASYPDSWSREFPARDYTHDYTFNDNTIADVIDAFLDAADIYGDDQYRAAALRGGEFILLAQMPEPQPAWAQQYDRDMHPVWARKFEPPAVTGGESQGVMRCLIELTRRTGEKRFLEPIPRAIAYLRASELPDGRLARFYELQTNTPLYFTKDYQLTYSSDDMPTHYSFIGPSALDSIEAVYKAVLSGEEAAESSAPAAPPADAVEKIIGALDERGAWVESGEMKYHENVDVDRVIDCRTFAANVRALAQFVAAQE
ncbi:MAG: hypothetical protein AMXMBFR82_08000 [Candidatus Hydrogenedentota bacterium]